MNNTGTQNLGDINQVQQPVFTQQQYHQILHLLGGGSHDSIQNMSSSNMASANVNQSGISNHLAHKFSINGDKNIINIGLIVNIGSWEEKVIHSCITMAIFGLLQP
ncbi:hypothetical protein BUALT_Bualt02G0166900 [Buddleja alternifolia]|uniref:Uncharacterized protein n=1 Tax=Buddleja alternifolia TaxID=168488 RepID=A0AAV6Y0V4_9LAMI|nr:hypothetical protein BUALT_Bualt02G0166900 [Buddleja alternifolia]